MSLLRSRVRSLFQAVNDLAPNCIAADSGQIHFGQLLYEVNGVHVRDRDAATSLVKAARGVVELTLSRNAVADIDEDALPEQRSHSTC